ncbi:MAG TPA: glycosyltransferase [Bacteroidales bacterium]|nr:glycosyltransferase [Bacteroidales bacterium]
MRKKHSSGKNDTRKKTIHICVINDLVSDQRVHRTALTLINQGFRVVAIGRELPQSCSLNHRPYRIKRFRLPVTKGPFFYALYNLYLFFYLLFRKTDGILANDLDTLPAAFLAAKIRRKTLVYDSHEYFTQVPELTDRPLTRRIWERIEATLLPYVRFAFTVSPSIAEAYNQQYGIQMKVVRNLPEKKSRKQPENKPLSFPGKQIILYQGAVNKGRGLEKMIQAMHHLENAMFVIIGTGDLMEEMKRLVEREQLSEKVVFTGRIQPENLPAYTQCATIGVSLEEDIGLNYRFALPNKIFDYIQAHVPVLVSPLPEMKKIVDKYQVGKVLTDNQPDTIATTIQHLFSGNTLQQFQPLLEKAADEFCWENEQQILLDIFREAGWMGTAKS